MFIPLHRFRLTRPLNTLEIQPPNIHKQVVQHHDLRTRRTFSSASSFASTKARQGTGEQFLENREIAKQTDPIVFQLVFSSCQHSEGDVFFPTEESGSLAKHLRCSDKRNEGPTVNTRDGTSRKEKPRLHSRNPEIFRADRVASFDGKSRRV